MDRRAISFAIISCVILAACGSDAAPGSTREGNPRKPAQAPAIGDSFDITNDDLNSALNDNNIIVLPYDPIEPKQIDYKTLGTRNEANRDLKSSSLTVVERESTRGANDAKRPSQQVAASQDGDAARSGSPNLEKMRDIAMNSREIRLVGPSQREVEMKDDLPTKVVVALENLKKETQEVLSTINTELDKSWTEIKRSEVWGQVNDKLDKGWTDLKGMVEGLVAPSQPAKNSG